MAPPAAPAKKETVVNETRVRGTISTLELKHLLFVIKSLCPEFGQEGEFHDHDRVYTPSPETRMPKNSIRLRKHLKDVGSARANGLEYVMMTYGLPDRRVPAPCEKRPVSYLAVGKEATEFLPAIGCTLVYEYLRLGMRFRARAGFMIELYMVKKFRKKGDVESAVQISPDPNDHHAVVDVVSETGAAPEELLAFMRHLEPLVQIPQPVGRR